MPSTCEECGWSGWIEDHDKGRDTRQMYCPNCGNLMSDWGDIADG